MDKPQILFVRLKLTFQVTCFVLAIYMAFKLFQRLLDNQDATVVSYRKYSQTEQDKYPTYSICFTGATIHWYQDAHIFKSFGIYSPELEKLVSGKSVMRYTNIHSPLKLYKREQFSWKQSLHSNFSPFHLKPSDILFKSLFVAENPLQTRVYEKGKDIGFAEFAPFYNKFNF